MDPLKHHHTWLICKEGLLGGIVNSLFGYTGSPSLTELIGYLVYLTLAYILYRNIERIHKVI